MPRKPVCFNCGAPSGAQIGNVRPPAHKKYVCTAKACWDRWYREFSHK